MKIIPLPEHWRDRAVIVTDIADPESWFDEDEMTMVRSFARSKRQREWMLSRIAEKELRWRGVQGTFVSFSHSGRFGAAAIDRQPIGIDVEMLRDISEAAAHLFLRDDEIDVMRRCAMPYRMLHFWSAKEALWKQQGGSIPTLKRVPLIFERSTSHGLLFSGAETIATEDLIAALTLPTS